jgi:hypothetical protein
MREIARENGKKGGETGRNKSLTGYPSVAVRGRLSNAAARRTSIIRLPASVERLSARKVKLPKKFGRQHKPTVTGVGFLGASVGFARVRELVHCHARCNVDVAEHPGLYLPSAVGC